MSYRPGAGALARFAAGGVLSFAVTMGTTALLHEALGLAETVAAAGGIGAALVVNFLFMRYYAFRGSAVSAVRQALMFLSSSGVFRGLEYLGFLALHLGLALSYLVAWPIVIGISFVLKFLVYDRWIFARAAAAKE